MNDKLQEMIEYLQDGSNYNKKEFIQDLSMKCKNTRNISQDELSISWGNKHIGDLESYNNEFFDLIINSVINVIESFKEDNGDLND